MKCIVIGLGTYGRVLVEELSALGHEVVAADIEANNVDRVKDRCSAAFQIDAIDEQALAILPFRTVDVVIVAIGANLGASVRIVALLKKMGVNHIFARATDMVHRNILQAFNIEKILIPEEEAARTLVRQMDLGVKVDLFRIDNDYCVYKFKTPRPLIGLSVKELDFEKNYNLRIIAVKKAGKTQNILGIEHKDSSVVQVGETDFPLSAEDELVCYGKESDFRRFCRVM